MSSNLTSSATSIFDCRLAIGDLHEYEVRYDKRAQNSQNRSADDVGEIMRAEIHPREPDQNRDWKAREANAPACDE